MKKALKRPMWSCFLLSTSLAGMVGGWVADAGHKYKNAGNLNIHGKMLSLIKKVIFFPPIFVGVFLSVFIRTSTDK